MNENSRTKHSVKNSAAAIVLKILQILFPFVNRTIVIHMLGISYIGLSGLFSSIYGILGLAELGVGGAMLHALYTPIQEHNQTKINQILNFYRKAYATIGLTVFFLGIAIMPFLKNFIKAGTYPQNINIYYIYMTNLVNTVSTYLIYAYKVSLLDAHQMGRATSKAKIGMTLVQYASQIAILLVIRNYYLYVTVTPITSIITAIIVGKIADKYYPQYKPAGSLSKEARSEIAKDIKALFLYKIGSVVNNSVDSVIISWWFGAVILGIYNNYYYIVSSIATLILVVYNAVLPSVGNSIASEAMEKNYSDFLVLSFGYNWIVGWCFICFICLLQPFIEIWTGSENTLNFTYSVLFAIYFYTWRMADVVALYKDAAGLWYRDKWRPLITAICNLTLNIILTRIIGLSGILISTILTTLMISYPISVKYLHSYFCKSSKNYFIRQVQSLMLTVSNAGLTYLICMAIHLENMFFTLFYRTIVCITLPNIIYFIVLHKTNNFMELKGFLHHKLNFLFKK